MPNSSNAASGRGQAASGRGKVYILVGLVVVLLAAVIYWSLGPSTEQLLSAESLTPSQIRRVATRLLIDDDINIRARANAKLISLGEPVVPVLKDLSLHCEDGAVRKAVLEILLTLKSNGTDELLGQMIADQNAEIRREAAGSAWALPPSQGGSIIDKGMTDLDPTVRLAAVGSMAKRNDPSTIPALEKALNDPMLVVRRHAARTLQSMTGKDYVSKVKPD